MRMERERFESVERWKREWRESERAERGRLFCSLFVSFCSSPLLLTFFALSSCFFPSPSRAPLLNVDRSAFLMFFSCFYKSSSSGFFVFRRRHSVSSFLLSFSTSFSQLLPPSAAVAISPASQSNASLTPSFWSAEIPATFQGRSEAREETG